MQDKQVVEQIKNGQPHPTANQPSAGIKPIPSSIVAAAAKTVAHQNQAQFDQLVIANLVAGFLTSEFVDLGAIGTAIVEESILALPLTAGEFIDSQQLALPPSLTLPKNQE
jgi:hypothetical protein